MHPILEAWWRAADRYGLAGAIRKAPSGLWRRLLTSTRGEPGVRSFVTIRDPRACSREMLPALENTLRAMGETIGTEPWEQPASNSSARDSALLPITDDNPWCINQRHSGETIVIFGAGPQLNSLTPPQIGLLSQWTTIGVNRTFLRVPLTYFISSYAWEVRLAQLGSQARCFHLTKIFPASPRLEGSVGLKRSAYIPMIGLPNRLYPPVPVIYSRRNVALAATHLALIMGARRIIYIGVEQSNFLHFWQTEPDMKKWLAEELQKLYQDTSFDYFSGFDRERTIGHCQEALLAEPDELRKTQFLAIKGNRIQHQDHSDMFRIYFQILRNMGIDVIGTSADSIVCRAGARFEPLSSLLTMGGS